MCELSVEIDGQHREGGITLIWVKQYAIQHVSKTSQSVLYCGH